MIQILGLRSFIPKDSKDGKLKTFDKVFPMSFPVPSVEFVFQNIDKILAEIPKFEHWNLFYTIANCETYTGKKEEKRSFISTEMIAFDIDDLDTKYLDQYIEQVLGVLKVDSTKIGMVSSGNGLHFLLKLPYVISDEKFFKKSRPHYKAIADKINTALEIAGIPGKTDTSVFDARRILRLPGTVNRKVDKPEKKCTLLQPITGTVDFNLEALSGVPTVKETDQIAPRLLKNYAKAPPGPVLEGCDFLKHCTNHADSIPEPLWYAALSITARLDGEAQNGYQASHDMSRGHHGYTSEGTDQKIDQALEASGPRTCSAIKQLWDGCSKCKHFEKVASPILIVGEGTIRTEHTGFHTFVVDSKGNEKAIPCHEDLIKYFQRESQFKTLDGSRRVYTWNKTHYKEFGKAFLEAFARNTFNPTVDIKNVVEFRKRVEISNIEPLEWWEKSTLRKINFQNGYLDIDTMEFKPHDPTLAFRNVLPYAYDPEALCPTFEKMLRLVTGNDQELITVLEEFSGYCLSNDSCWAQKALILPGEGANGKSTFLDTLKNLAGVEYVSHVKLGTLTEPYNAAKLDGAILNIAEETAPKDLRDTTMFKTIVTGGTILVRLPYKEPYYIENKAKLCITCNALPDTTDNSHGFHRRLLIVPFNQAIETTAPDYDPHMTEKLKAELPGIFNRVIAAYKRLVVQKRFSDSQRINDSVEEYKTENDSVLYWAKEFLIVHTNGGYESFESSLNDLYENYKSVTKGLGSYPVKAQKFYKDLKKIKAIWGEHPYSQRLERKRKTVNGKEQRLFMVKGVEVPESY